MFIQIEIQTEMFRRVPNPLHQPKFALETALHFSNDEIIEKTIQIPLKRAVTIFHAGMTVTYGLGTVSYGP